MIWPAASRNKTIARNSFEWAGPKLLPWALGGNKASCESGARIPFDFYPMAVTATVGYTFRQPTNWALTSKRIGPNRVWPELGICITLARGGKHRRPMSCPARSTPPLCPSSTEIADHCAKYGNARMSASIVSWRALAGIALIIKLRTGSSLSKLLIFFRPNEAYFESERYPGL